VAYLCAVGLLDERLKRPCEDLIVIRTAEDTFFAKLIECKSACRAGCLLLGRVAELIVAGLGGEKAAEQVVNGDVAPDRTPSAISVR